MELTNIDVRVVYDTNICPADRTVLAVRASGAVRSRGVGGGVVNGESLLVARREVGGFDLQVVAAAAADHRLRDAAAVQRVLPVHWRAQLRP